MFTDLLPARALQLIAGAAISITSATTNFFLLDEATVWTPPTFPKLETSFDIPLKVIGHAISSSPSDSLPGSVHAPSTFAIALGLLSLLIFLSMVIIIASAINLRHIRAKIQNFTIIHFLAFLAYAARNHDTFNKMLEFCGELSCFEEAQRYAITDAHITHLLLPMPSTTNAASIELTQYEFFRLLTPTVNPRLKITHEHASQVLATDSSSEIAQLIELRASEQELRQDLQRSKSIATEQIARLNEHLQASQHQLQEKDLSLESLQEQLEKKNDMLNTAKKSLEYASLCHREREIIKSKDLELQCKAEELIVKDETIAALKKSIDTHEHIFGSSFDDEASIRQAELVRTISQLNIERRAHAKTDDYYQAEKQKNAELLEEIRLLRSHCCCSTSSKPEPAPLDIEHESGEDDGNNAERSEPPSQIPSDECLSPTPSALPSSFGDAGGYEEPFPAVEEASSLGDAAESDDAGIQIADQATGESVRDEAGTLSATSFPLPLASSPIPEDLQSIPPAQEHFVPPLQAQVDSQRSLSPPVAEVPARTLADDGLPVTDRSSHHPQESTAGEVDVMSWQFEQVAAVPTGSVASSLGPVSSHIYLEVEEQTLLELTDHAGSGGDLSEGGRDVDMDRDDVRDSDMSYAPPSPEVDMIESPRTSPVQITDQVMSDPSPEPMAKNVDQGVIDPGIPISPFPTPTSPLISAVPQSLTPTASPNLPTSLDSAALQSLSPTASPTPTTPLISAVPQSFTPTASPTPPTPLNSAAPQSLTVPQSGAPPPTLARKLKFLPLSKSPSGGKKPQKAATTPPLATSGAIIGPKTSALDPEKERLRRAMQGSKQGPSVGSSSIFGVVREEDEIKADQEKAAARAEWNRRTQ